MALLAVRRGTTAGIVMPPRGRAPAAVRRTAPSRAPRLAGSIGAALWLLAAGCAGPPEMSPLEGPVQGGTTVLVRRADVIGPGIPQVFVGRDAARAVVVERSDALAFVTPPAPAAGEVPIHLDYPDGSRVTLAAGFTYVDEGIVIAPPPPQP
jgi:hypothetical protein